MGTEVSKVKQILRGQMRQALAELSDQERAWSDGEANRIQDQYCWKYAPT